MKVETSVIRLSLVVLIGGRIILVGSTIALSNCCNLAEGGRTIQEDILNEAVWYVVHTMT